MRKQLLTLFLSFSLLLSLSLSQIGGYPPFFIPGLPLNSPSRQYHHLPLGLKALEPESIAFDCEGRGPYVGVSDGRILRWENPQIGWIVFAVTSPNRTKRCDGVSNFPMEKYCGRPLGMKFNTETCELYVTDSSFGLLRVGRHGGVATTLATSAEGIPFHFLNNLDLDVEGGAIYFTDSSSYFHRWDYPLAIATSDHSGRLMKYDLLTRTITVLLKGLFFANGVALSKNKDFVLITETTAKQVRRFWLTGPKAGLSEVFLPVYDLPDNINRNANGDFWIAQNPFPPIKVDEYGTILEVLTPTEIIIPSDIVEIKNSLWIGSVVQNHLTYTT